MNTDLQIENDTACFLLKDVPPSLQDAVRGLYYSPVADDGATFAKQFPADTPHLAHIYANFARHAADMVYQAAGQQPVPWAQGLRAFLERIAGQDLGWMLVGSGALAVCGLDVAPHDLDLVVDVDSAVRLNDLLLDVLVEPPQPSPGWIWDSFSRAFWHTRLEWVSGVNATADRPEVADFGPTAVRRAETIRWQGYDIKVPPLDLQYQVSARRGLTDRAAKIKESLP